MLWWLSVLLLFWRQNVMFFRNGKAVLFIISGSLSSMISDPPLRARTRLDEILGRGTSPRLLERPVTGEKDTPQPEKSSAGRGDTVSTDTDLPNTEMKTNTKLWSCSVQPLWWMRRTSRSAPISPRWVWPQRAVSPADSLSGERPHTHIYWTAD